MPQRSQSHGVRGSEDPSRSRTGPAVGRRRVVLAVLATSSLLWAKLLLAAAPAQAAGMISALSLSPQTVSNGASAVGTVTLAYADPEDTQVLLFSSDTSAATVPASITVPAGDMEATFSVATNASAPETAVTITAWVGNTNRARTLLVNPAPSGPSLSSVAVTPSSLTGGSGATGTVTFSATTDGAVVQLASSAPSIAQVPAETVVNGGAASGTFAVTTATVSTSTNVTITASHAGTTRATTITVSPGEAAATDVVRITRATYSRGWLRIEATSSNATAILSVYGPTGNFMYTMNNLGGGKYAVKRATKFPPDQVTVRSNLGGSATATVRR